MKNPNIISVEYFTNTFMGRSSAFINGKWVLCRPEGLSYLSNRFKLAWMVFTGKADALIWPEGQ